MNPVLRNLMFSVVAAALLVGCGGKPVPAEKSNYVGEWQHPTMYLRITQDGSVKYKYKSGGTTRFVTAPLKSFDGDNIVVGLEGRRPTETIFVVSEPPHKEGESWVMTVDGVQLTRTNTLQ